MNAWEERQDARAEGVAEGEQREARRIARNMLEKRMDVKTIAEITELSEKEVRELQQ